MGISKSQLTNQLSLMESIHRSVDFLCLLGGLGCPVEMTDTDAYLEIYHAIIEANIEV